MAVLADHTTRSGYRVWQKGPATGHTWQQTATDPNAHDRPATVAYLTADRLTLWQQQLASNDAAHGPRQEAITVNAKAPGQWPSEEAGRYIKVNHGGTAPTAPAMDSETWTYTYDANGNVDSIDTDSGTAVYGYDALDRLTQDARPGQPAHSLSYDRNGNRTAISDGTGTTTSHYRPNSNRLDTLGGTPITRDPAGNRTSDQNGNRTFEYNNTGRLHKVYQNGTLVATYTYNHQSQRTRKITPGGTTIYHYDQNGNLISETDGSGNPIRDIVYRDTVPIAQIDSGPIETVTYLHTDHLGSPRRGTNETGTVVWTWNSDAFGAAAANDDPDGDGIATIVNLRFPGQYFDSETGLHYNYFRTYDPSTGRYLESDPIGLAGGLNTYAYVAGNPIRYIDLLGLEITGRWAGFDASVTGWEYTGLTPHLERGPNGNDLVDRIGYFNFLVSGTLRASVECKETDNCGNVKREWTLDGSVAVNGLEFRVPYDEPATPIPGMGYVIWADKVLRTGQYLNQWRGMIQTAGRALLNAPTLICKGNSFLK